MPKRCLCIVERAYRGTIEEQYGHILWLTRALRKMKAPIDLLLQGNAALYARRNARPPVLTIGGMPLHGISEPNAGVGDLVRSGVTVYVSEEDRARLGIPYDQLVEGVVPVSVQDVARILGGYDQVWFG